MSPRPELLPLSDAPVEARQEAARRCARALDAGELVVLPTETVYGLCARATHADEVFAAKGRPPEKALPFFVSGVEDVPTFANHLPPRLRTLMEAHWPGPLTLVVGEDPGVALRCPDVAFTRRVVALTEGPIVATSANRSGERPATQADAAMELGPVVSLIADDGPSVLGRASSIARVGMDGRMTWLRVGAGPDPAATSARHPRTVLFLCTGNTCRSPMAERLGARILGPDAAARGLRFASAGVAAAPGAPVSEGARRALEAVGLSAEDHRATPLTADLLAGTDLVLALGPGHAQVAQEMAATHGFWRPEIALLDPEGAVPDPFGGDERAYAAARDRITSALERFLLRAADRLPGEN